MLVITGLAAPLYAGTEGWKAGCLVAVVLIWGVLVASPLGLLVIMGSTASSETAKEKWVGLTGALAIVGYFIAIFASVLVIGVSSLRLR
jgi:hypothetical protein